MRGDRHGSGFWLKHVPLHAGADVEAPDGTPSRILIRDTWNTEIPLLVLEDCVAEPIAADALRSNHEASLTVLELLFASITDSAAVLEALADLPSAARTG